MITFIIDRFAENDYGTFGVMSHCVDEKIPFAVTLEKPWRNNEENVSCIPPGIYYCTRFNSSHFGETFMIMNVPDRTDVLFHWGNLERNTKGCVLIAEKFGELYGKIAILESNLPEQGFNEFMQKTDEAERIKLIINDFTRIYG